MAWLKDLFAKKTAAGDVTARPGSSAQSLYADAACSFCGRSRLQVQKLIAAPERVYICETCVAACVTVLEDEDPYAPVSAAQDFMLRQIQRLAMPTDLAASSRLVTAALALAGGDAVACRAIVNLAVSVHDPASAALALASIRAPERTIDDAVDEALLHDQAGAIQTALAQLDALDVAAFTAEHSVIVPLHRAKLRLDAGLADRAEARAFDALGDQVIAALPAFTLSERYTRDLHREILLGRARAALALGDPDRTVTLLEPHVASATDGYAWALLHEAYLARGDHQEALTARARALETEHPESALAIRLCRQSP